MVVMDTMATTATMPAANATATIATMAAANATAK